MTQLQVNERDLQKTVGQWVAERAGRARVFEQYGIDYCCGGKLPLSEAAAQKGVDTDALLAELRGSDRQATAEHGEWGQASLSELIDHILDSHHAYLRRELPRLAQLTAKVAQVHAARHIELVEVAQVFAAVRAELEAHMFKEEQILFPWIRRIEAGVAGAGHCGSLANPIRQMEHEHDTAGEALAALRSLTRDYAVPADACGSYRAMLDGLAEFERDLHWHIHEENNILFPKAMALEQRAVGL